MWPFKWSCLSVEIQTFVSCFGAVLASVSVVPLFAYSDSRDGLTNGLL